MQCNSLFTYSYCIYNIYILTILKLTIFILLFYTTNSLLLLVFQRIFYGLSMSSTVYASKVRVWLTPYTRGTDQLSVIKNDYENVISANFSKSTGVMELVQKGGKELTKYDWDKVLNYPSYRLFINVRILSFWGDYFYDCFLLLFSIVFTIVEQFFICIYN